MNRRLGEYRGLNEYRGIVHRPDDYRYRGFVRWEPARVGDDIAERVRPVEVLNGRVDDGVVRDIHRGATLLRVCDQPGHREDIVEVDVGVVGHHVKGGALRVFIDLKPVDDGGGGFVHVRD